MWSVTSTLSARPALARQMQCVPFLVFQYVECPMFFSLSVPPMPMLSAGLVILPSTKPCSCSATSTPHVGGAPGWSVLALRVPLLQAGIQKDRAADRVDCACWHAAVCVEPRVGGRCRWWFCKRSRDRAAGRCLQVLNLLVHGAVVLQAVQ